MDELGDTSVVVFKVGDTESRVSTIVIRGSTDNYMDDIERAIDDGVNVFKGLCKVRSRSKASMILAVNTMKLLLLTHFP